MSRSKEVKQEIIKATFLLETNYNSHSHYAGIFRYLWYEDASSPGWAPWSILTDFCSTSLAPIWCHHLLRLFMLLVGGWIPSPKYMTQWPSRVLNPGLTIRLRTLARSRYPMFYLIRYKRGICAIHSVIFKNGD